MDFKQYKEVCQYGKPGFDSEYSQWELTCRHKENKPRGHSWGDCKIDNCPFFNDDN